MSISDEELDFEHHIEFYRGLGFLTGNLKTDAHWHHEAECAHTLLVSDAVRDAIFTVVTLAQSVESEEAKTQLNFGVARRTKFIWLSLRRLFGLIAPDRNEPLPSDDVEKAAQDLNAIYINIRGTLDNLAWCLVDLFCEEKTQRLLPVKIDLFGAEFLKDANLREVAEFVNGSADWNRELKARRNPAAHRIPLSVPPAFLNAAAQKEYARISAEYTEVSNAAARAVGEGADSSVLFEKATLLNDRLQRVGTFSPVFVHHLDEGATKIYPLVPQDIGQLVKIVRGLTDIISGKLAA